MLESIGECGQSDEISNASRGHSVSNQTAKVKDLVPMTMNLQCRSSLGYSQLIAHSSHGFVMELPDRFGSFPLTPLIATDFGGFLAVAALLDRYTDQQL